MKNLLVRIGLDPSGFNSGMSKLLKTAESTSKKIKKALTTIDVSTAVNDALGTGGNPSTRISEITAANVDQARQQLQTLTEYRNQLQSIGFDDNSTDAQYGMVSERIRELTYDISAYEAELQQQAQAQREAAQAAQDSSQQQVAAAKNATAAEQEKGRALDQSANAARRSANPIRSLAQWLRSAKSSGNGIDTVSTRVRNLGSSAKSSRTSISQMINSLRRISLVSLGLRIASSALGELRSIVSQYISENSALQAQVNGLKSGMGQALAPAVNLVTNAMSALMPYVLGVSDAIGQLMSLLFGAGWTAATQGAKQTATATGGAAKAQKELNRQLMSFDEINKLSSESSSSSGGGSSSGTAITSIDSETPAWLERFKSTFSELFNSDDFQAANIGGKIGMSLQAGLDWLGTEAMHFDWSEAGKTLREDFDSFMESGWEESLWETVGIFLGGFSDLLIGYFVPDWDKLKEAYNDGGIMCAVEYSAGILDELSFNPISWLFEGSLSPVFSGLTEYFRENGHEGIAGFFQGISDFCDDPGLWLKEHIVDPITSKAEELPLKFSEIGEDLMEDLARGIVRKVSDVLGKLQELKESVFSIADNLESAFSFDWKMPSLQLPHLSLSWEPVDNVVAKFFGVSAFPHLNVNWYAKGGILDGAQIFGRMGSTYLGGGEAGKEAVLPLEHNTEWMDMVAERVIALLPMQNSGDVNVTIPVTVDGDVIEKIVVKGLRKRARANGGLSW